MTTDFRARIMRTSDVGTSKRLHISSLGCVADVHNFPFDGPRRSIATACLTSGMGRARETARHVDLVCCNAAEVPTEPNLKFWIFLCTVAA